MRILLIGPPGVGKGTQAAMLHERLGVPRLASGDIFRAEMRQETELGKLAKSFMDRGELVPDEVTIDMMARRIMSPESREKGFVLDGFPRTLAQAEALDRLLDSLSMPLERVIAIVVPDEVVVERISGRMSCPNCGAIYHRSANPPRAEGVCDHCGGKLLQRPDDGPETVRERLRVFHGTTESVLSYYMLQGKLIRIDGSGSPEAVFKTLEGSLGR